jgi:homeobox-leucine zipper protein
MRYYKQNADETWVDISLNSLLPGSVLNCQRQLSGCLIQEKPNGYSNVCCLSMIEIFSFHTFSVQYLMV